MEFELKIRVDGDRAGQMRAMEGEVRALFEAAEAVAAERKAAEAAVEVARAAEKEAWEEVKARYMDYEALLVEAAKETSLKRFGIGGGETPRAAKRPANSKR